MLGIKGFLFAVAVAFMLCSQPGAVSAQQPYEAVINKLSAGDTEYKVTLGSWKCRKSINDDMLDPHYEPKKGWKKCGPGFAWPEGQSFWFHTVFTMPEEVEGRPVAGSKVVIRATINHFGHIYINGKHENYFRHNKGEALLTMNAVPGEEYVIVMEGIHRESAGVFADAYVTFSALDEVSRKTNDYINRVRAVELLLDKSGDKDKWIKLLNESAAVLDIDAREAGDVEKYVASLGQAGGMLSAFGEVAKQYTIYLLGHSHLDLAYRWDYRDGETAWVNTVDTILKLMEEYPDFKFSQTQAHGYKWLEDDYPDINDRLQSAFPDGRWEVTGGAWSEHDGNLTGGEALVRQYLYGKRFFREKFGVDVKTAWLPDVFGFNWNLPQILARSGITGFYTTKINWNDTNKFPYNIFWWQGPDGSRVMAYQPVGGTSESVDAGGMAQQMRTVEERHGVKDQLVVFGMGDHGGGVSRTHLNRAFALKNSDVYPRIEFVSGQEYFDHLRELAKTHEFPVYNDELYLEYHRGTLTTQAEVKKGNRAGEILQETAEKYASIALLYGKPYPYNRIFDGWYTIMLNHMHDILPGSHIPRVAGDAHRDYAAQREMIGGVITESVAEIASRIDTGGEGVPVIIFNQLSWRRDAVIEIPVTPAMPPMPGIAAPDGAAVPFQFTTDDADRKHILFVARGIPAMGYAVYRVVGSMTPPEKTDLALGKGSLENSLVKIIIDPESGKLVSVSDKKSGREFLGVDGANFIQLYNDNPSKYDAWNINIQDEIPLESSGGVSVVENGPVRVTLKFTKKAGKSAFDQYVTLHENYPLVEGRIDADWRERHVIAKLAFNVLRDSEKCWFEIPYAAIGRNAVAQNSIDEARWEVSGQKWVDCSDAGASGGLALLNDSKYGFDVKGDVLRMTLLRGATEPDPDADLGHHSIRYALLPHGGDWREAAAPRAGHEFNYPAEVYVTDSHPGELPKEKSFFSCEPENVILSAVKMAEDKDGVVVRLFETSGIDTTATIKFPREIATASEVNLIEDHIADLDVSGDTMELPISHYEIKTLKLVFK